MNGNRRVIAVTALIALLAGGGALFAVLELVSSHSSSPPAAAPPAGVGVNGEGLGERIGGRGFDGGLGLGREPSRRGYAFGRFPDGGLAPTLAYLGISSSTLRSDLGRGETLAQIAAARGKPIAGLVSALLADRRRELDRQVSAGYLTAAGERQIEAREPEQIRELVDGAGSRGRGPIGGRQPDSASG